MDYRTNVPLDSSMRVFRGGSNVGAGNVPLDSSMRVFRGGSNMGVEAPLPPWTPLEPPSQTILAIDEEREEEKEEEEEGKERKE